MTWREAVIAGCCALILLLWYNVAYAQIDPKNPTQTCVPLTVLTKESKLMDQMQIIRGLNQRQELIIITADPYTERWTAWQSVQGTHLCVVAFGTVFTLVEKVGHGS